MPFLLPGACYTSISSLRQVYTYYHDIGDTHTSSRYPYCRCSVRRVLVEIQQFVAHFATFVANDRATEGKSGFVVGYCSGTRTRYSTRMISSAFMRMCLFVFLFVRVFITLNSITLQTSLLSTKIILTENVYCGTIAMPTSGCAHGSHTAALWCATELLCRPLVPYSTILYYEYPILVVPYLYLLGQSTSKYRTQAC